jgi:hypothetical protein
MFGSTILEVAIGMVFVYLLLSLLCSALAELIEALFKYRAKDLKKGVATLLDDPSLVEGLYRHPLVQALGKNPSYIPSRTFSLALWNIATTAGQEGEVATTVTRNLRQIRTTVVALPHTKVRQALLTLIDEAGDDLDRARQNIERWYDDVMDRVSGWYKRRTQGILMVIGLLAAGFLNIDSITILRSLSQDTALRDSLVAAAEGYARTPPSEGDPEARIKNTLAQIRALGLPIGWDLTAERRNPSPPATSQPQSAGEPENPRVWPKDLEGSLFKILGFLVTALAVSLGAPFWFDLLNKFMVVRSTVKPREKSPEVPTKDRPAPETEIEKEEDEGQE